MSFNAKDALIPCISISLIVFGYYLVLSNQRVLSNLYDENGVLYAFIATFMMILLGTLMGVMWGFIDNLRGTEGVTSKKADENLAY